MEAENKPVVDRDARRFARGLETQHEDNVSPRDRSRTQPVHNERQSAAQHTQTFSETGFLRVGRIAYAVPYLNWYRVVLDGANTDCPCCRITETPLQPFGVSDTSPLPVNSWVLVWKTANYPWGFILGVIPDVVCDGGRLLPDWISQGSQSGFHQQPHYNQLLQLLGNSGGLKDFSNGRPLDATALGEFGRISTLGGGAFVDLLMNFIRGDETCGLWTFYIDRLTRLAGYNLDLFTALSELVVRNDQGEGTIKYGSTPYPWEELGGFAWGAQVLQITSDNDDVLKNKPVGKYEPMFSDQVPFHRYEEYEGYLGQGFMRQVSVPPASRVSSGDDQPGAAYRLQDEDCPITLLREQLGMDGSYGLASAHSISITKRVIIPCPKRMKLAEDSAGDTPDNYKFAGQFGNGPTPQIGNLPASGQLPDLRTATGLLDFEAHLWNWKGLHPFYYHQKDFLTPEESAVPPLERLQLVPSFSDLATSMWLSAPDPKQIWVDARYGEQSYYETTSGIFFPPDGSVVIRDGYGSQILMSGGNVIISAAGDVMNLPGRRSITMAGDDAIIRANNSVDVTSTNKDVRVKAQVNLELLGGNGGEQGRVLIENQASSIEHTYKQKVGEDIQGSGILLKTKTQLVAWAQDIYLRTGGGDVPAGDILLDANQGKQDIRTISQSFYRNLELQAVDAFPAMSNTKKEVFVTTPDGVQLDGALDVNGLLQVLDVGAIIKGDVDIVAGNISAQNNVDGKVQQLAGPALSICLGELSDARSGLQQAEQDAGQDYQANIDQLYYVDGKVGNDSLIQQVSFSLRNEKQYGTTDFQLPVAYWQQLLIGAAGEGDAGGGWTENTVLYQGQDLMPFPGNMAWSEDTTFYILPLNLFDATTGRDKPRGAPGSSLYENPTYKDWSPETPNGNYPINPMN